LTEVTTLRLGDPFIQEHTMQFAITTTTHFTTCQAQVVVVLNYATTPPVSLQLHTLQHARHKLLTCGNKLMPSRSPQPAVVVDEEAMGATCFRVMVLSLPRVVGQHNTP
jgi:hypothetical protein